MLVLGYEMRQACYRIHSRHCLRGFDFSEVLVWKEGKTRFRVRAIHVFLNNFILLARCNPRRAWNLQTIASARKTYSTQSSSII